MLIAKIDEPQNPPVDREPIPGRWYHGQTPQGSGNLIKYLGEGAWVLADGEPAPSLSYYEYLVEH